MTTIVVYNLSTRVASFTRADAREAWREAIRHTRFLDAFGHRAGSGGHWYQTANRAGYTCGSYRATSERATRKRKLNTDRQMDREISSAATRGEG